MKISKRVVKKFAKDLEINTDILPVDTIIQGMKVELEHGLVSTRTNITNNDLLMTLKIALAHFEESGPCYYDELKKMEDKLSKKWKNKSIFIS